MWCWKSRVPPGALLFLAPSFALGQVISAGVTGAVPISNHSQDYGPACFVTRSAPASANQTICGPNDFLVRPYAVGPTVAAQLPWRVLIEAGMLYQRFHKDVSQGAVPRPGGSVTDFGQYFGASANGWLFPLQVKYTFRGRKLLPFVSAGATLRHLGAFDGAGIQLDQLRQGLG